MKYKEFLNSKDGYKLIVLPEHAGDDEKSGLIEVPEGAECLTKCYDEDEKEWLLFWTENCKWCVGFDEEWVIIQDNLDWYIEAWEGRASIIWQRHTQPEELPFIDDEPKSINDQYAEIEQVRQDGLKFDNGKPRHSLLPKGSISSIIAVLEFGAKKYEANNWQKVDNAKERYYDAAMRHIDSWWSGEKFDQETGIHHLAHAATNLFFLKWFDDKENNNG